MELSATACMLIATLAFAITNIAVKALSDLPTHQVVFMRGIIALVICILWFVKEGKSPWGTHRSLLIGRGVFGTIGLWLYFYTVQRIPLGTAQTLNYLSPIFTVLWSGVFLSERVSWKQAFAFCIAVIGIAIVKGFDDRITWGFVFAGVLSAAAAGAAYTIIRKIGNSENPMTIVFYFPLVTTPTVGFYTLTHWQWPTQAQWMWLLLMGIVVQIAQLFLTMAYQKAPATRVSIYFFLGSPIAVLFGWLFFNETIPSTALFGLAIVLSGILYHSLQSRKTKTA